MNAPLTLERMRADVAELLGMSPAEVADDENLVDLGIDSLQIMTLADRWSRAGGVRIDFPDLAEHPAVGAWWRIASERVE